MSYRRGMAGYEDDTFNKKRQTFPFSITTWWGVNTLRQRQNGRRFPDDTFKRISLNENVRLSVKISLKFVPKGPINSIPALVQIMAWRWSGDKPLSEAMMFSLLTHICVTRPQWVNHDFISIIPGYEIVGFASVRSCVHEHICWSCQKVIPASSRNDSAKCNYLIIMDLLFYSFHWYLYNFEIFGKTLHLFALFSNHQSMIQLIFGQL